MAGARIAKALGSLLGKLMGVDAVASRQMPLVKALQAGYKTPEAFELSKRIAEKALKEHGAELSRVFPMYNPSKDLGREVVVNLVPPYAMKAFGTYHPTIDLIELQAGLPSAVAKSTLAHEGVHAIFRKPILRGKYTRLFQRENPLPGDLSPSAWRKYYGSKLEIDPRLAELKREMIHAGQIGSESTWKDVVSAAKNYLGIRSDAGLAAHLIAKTPPAMSETLAKRLLQLLGIGGVAATPILANAGRHRA